MTKRSQEAAFRREFAALPLMPRPAAPKPVEAPGLSLLDRRLLAMVRLLDASDKLKVVEFAADLLKVLPPMEP